MRVAIVLLAASLVSGCTAEGDRPGIVVSPDMAITIPFDPYDPNPVTANGATLLLPPEGTVPVGGFRFPYGATPEEAVRAGAELRNPFEADRGTLARGKQVFDTFCVVCHGPEGLGDGPVGGVFAGRTLLEPRVRNLPDGTLFHIITRGGPALMASYAVQVRPDDRWRVILYVRSLQGAK